MTNAIPSDSAYCLHYDDGMFLTANYMATEQRFFLTWNALQNRMLYTPGVLDGLAVAKRSDQTLSVESGGGFDRQGRFLLRTDGSPDLALPSGIVGPCFVHLAFPVKDQLTKQSQVKNLAALAQISASVEPPDDGLLLAEITVSAEGRIETVIDRRERARHRIAAG